MGDPSSVVISEPSLEEKGLRIEVRMLRQELLATRTVNHEYEVLIASLFTALKRVLSGVCFNCKATVEKFAPPHFAAMADVIDPAGPPRFRAELSNSHFSRRIFEARRGGSLLSPNSDPPSSHAVQHKVAKAILEISSAPIKQPKITTTRASSSSSRADLKIPRSAEKNTFYGWSIKTNKKVKPSMKIDFESVRKYEGGSVACVKFSSGGYLAAGVNKKGGGWQVRIYDMKTAKKKFVLVDLFATKSNSQLCFLCFSPNDQYLAIADSDRKICIWEIKKNLVRTILKGHTQRVTSIDFSPDGRFLASSSEDRTVRIWSMRDGLSKILEDNAQPYFQVRFSPNGRHIAAVNDDGLLRMWNARTGRLVTRWRAHDDVVRGLVFRPDGTGLFTGSHGGVRCWKIGLPEMQTQSDENKEILKLRTLEGFGVCLNISPNGRWYVCAFSLDQPLRIVDAANLEMQCTLQGKQILSADFGPTGEFLASGSADGQLALWRYGAT